MMLHPTEKEERLYLDEIEKELKEELVELDEKLQEYQEKILGLKQYMYENQAQLDNVEKAMSRVSVLEEALFWGGCPQAEKAGHQADRLAVLRQDRLLPRRQRGSVLHRCVRLFPRRRSAQSDL